MIREAENEVMWLQVRECGQLPGGRNKKTICPGGSRGRVTLQHLELRFLFFKNEVRIHFYFLEGW